MFSENNQSSVHAKDDYDKSIFQPKKAKVNSWSLLALTENKGDVGMESQDGKAAERGPHAASRCTFPQLQKAQVLPRTIASQKKKIRLKKHVYKFSQVIRMSCPP